MTEMILTITHKPVCQQRSYILVAHAICFLGFWWLPGENLGHRWRPPPGNTPWPLSRDLWHGCQPREHSPCLSELWQNHQSVVPTHLCTHHCSAGPWCLHHIHSGETDACWRNYSCKSGNRTLFQVFPEQPKWPVTSFHFNTLTLMLKFSGLYCTMSAFTPPFVCYCSIVVNVGHSLLVTNQHWLCILLVLSCCQRDNAVLVLHRCRRHGVFLEVALNQHEIQVSV